MRGALLLLLLRVVQAWDRLRLRGLQRAHPGLRIDPSASTNLAVARFELAAGAELVIGPGVVTERLPGELCFHVESGGRVEVGRETWLRCEVEKIRLVAYSGGRLTVAAECFLNGCQLSAKERVEVARGAMIGPGCRVYDSDQHPLDESTPERPKPVEIGECSWIASDVTVSKGSVIGEHSVIGTRSLVAGQIDAHTLAYGVPAVPRASVGKRRPFL